MTETKTEVVDIKSMNVYQRMHHAAQLIERRIPKSNTNEMQKFKFASHDDVVEFLRPCLLESRLVITSSMPTFETERIVTKTDRGDKMTSIFRGTLVGNIVNIDNPTDCYSVSVPVEAYDTSDKASGKAFSYAKKYLLVTACGLLAATGTDVDMEGKFPSKRPVKGEKAAETKEAKKVLLAEMMTLRDELGWTKEILNIFGRDTIGRDPKDATPGELQKIVEKLRDTKRAINDEGIPE